eukprot:CAMPEP_0194276256 /NCGR_PEP_ID=MMETSP0169-20130528/8893_1 /TAXON_ID=218684 /ORGANISM="Corethron pennatum, Strain L29A3" /LENGTH=192 /DNA_ID=CAMNT_0039019933 /DNA_START=93 /DNA_END=668 /DNA_ORIENTATION=+
MTTTMSSYPTVSPPSRTAMTSSLGLPPSSTSTVPIPCISSGGTDEIYYRVVYRGAVALLSSRDPPSSRSGAYLSYGEIIASSGTASGSAAVRVDRVLTGGYALDAQNSGDLGYLPLHLGNATVSEQVPAPAECSSSPFSVVANGRTPVLTGPAGDAPPAREVIYPGTAHECCLSVRPVGGGGAFYRLRYKRG